MSFFMKVAGTFLTAFLFTWFILPKLSRLARRIGLLDIPNLRKVHNQPKPLVGGLGMVMAVCLSGVLFIPLTDLRGYFAGMIVLVIAGFLDDFRELDHKWKFVAQIVASLLAIYLSNTRLFTFGNLIGTGEIRLGILSVPLTIFCMVGVINALNMIDGLDGLAGINAIVGFSCFGLLASYTGQYNLLLLSLALTGALIGFLQFNWFPSRLFMGDAGSLTIGYSLAYMAIALTQKKTGNVSPVTPLLILALPIVDAVMVMTKRIVNGKNPFQPDTNHMHHNLMLLGYSKKTTVEVIGLMAFIIATIGAMGTMIETPDYLIFGIFSLYLLGHGFFTFTVKKAASWTEERSKTGEPLLRILTPTLFRHIDTGTGLLNPAALTENLKVELKLSEKDGDLSVILITHPALFSDDEATFTSRLTEYLRSVITRTDILGIYDKGIMIILPETTRSGAIMTIEKIRERESASIYGISEKDLNDLSFGVASTEDVEPSVESMINSASLSLLQYSLR